MNDTQLPGRVIPLACDALKNVSVNDWIISSKPITGDLDGWGEVTAPKNSIGYVCDINTYENSGESYLSVTVAFPPGIICILDEHDSEKSLSKFGLMVELNSSSPKKPVVTYNHAYDLAFKVSHSTDPLGEDVTAKQVREALALRLASISDNELMEGVGAPFNTYEEQIPCAISPI